jgi:hypothetical protein
VRRIQVGPIQTYLLWRDAWVGAYLSPTRVLYLCPLPFWVWRIPLGAQPRPGGTDG